MTLKLDPDRTDKVSQRLRALVRATHEATLPNDLDTIRTRLRAVKDAYWAAAEAINEAEQETRAAALQELRA